MNPSIELVDEARALLNGPSSDRAAFVQKDCWIHTPTTKVVFQWMEYLLRSERVRRPRCMQIVAPAGMGKSSMLQEFSSRHPIVSTENPLRTMRAVLLADATDAGGGAKALRRSIMRGAWPDAKSFPDGQDDIDATLQAQGVRLLLLDEAGDLMKCGPSLQRQTVTELKRISNHLRVNIVSAAVEGLDHVLRQDDQLYSRFKPIIKVPEWNETQDFRNFLYGIETHLPFPERSYLDSVEMVRWLLRYGRGNTHDTILYIRDAALWATHRGARFVSIQDLESARTSATPPPIMYGVAA
jgi:hypothetical protein